MSEVIEASCVSPISAVDVYIVMYRYCRTHWSACTTSKTLEDAQRYISMDTSLNIDAWKIVKVPGLPIDVPAGEAKEN